MKALGLVGGRPASDCLGTDSRLAGLSKVNENVIFLVFNDNVCGFPPDGIGTEGTELLDSGNELV